MLYSFAKILMTAGLRFFYRHIHVTGFENIPSKGPVIIIANHNSSLMDAALLGILLKRRAWFFARGDVFINKPIRTVLWWLHMMPVHSYHGGRRTLGANNNSFSDGQRILSKGGIIVFFPESTSHIEHQLLPFRKGVFRLAFDTAAANNYTFDIPVVPVGITYDHPVACRTDVQVYAGKPLLLSAYVAEYKENAPAALLHICKDAHQSIKTLMLHVEDRNRLHTTEQLLIVSRNNDPVLNDGWKIASTAKLEREKTICNTINQATVNEFEDQQVKAGNYFSALTADGIADKTVTSKRNLSAGKKIMLWVGFPFYLAGLVLNGLPVLVARLVADKMVSRTDFYSWIFVACYSFIYFCWLAVLLIAGGLFGWPYAGGLLLIMIATGIFAYHYKDWLKENRQQMKWQSLTNDRVSELQAMRNAMQS